MKLTYRIAGMHCSACVEKIKSALSSQLKTFDVTLNPPMLTLDDQAPPSLDDLNKAIAAAGNYRLSPMTNQETTQEKNGLLAYYPIFLIAIYITGVAFITNTDSNGIHWQGWMNHFMAGFFLVFSAFKFLDLRGFAQGYASYDLLAKRIPAYGFLYPFLELGLGILYLGAWLPVTTLVLTIIIMGFSSLGVINSLMKKQKLQCACLGTLLNVPLSSITLIEDLTMVVMAMLSLFMI